MQQVIFHLREIKWQICARRRGRLGLCDIWWLAGDGSRIVLPGRWRAGGTERSWQRIDLARSRLRRFFVGGDFAGRHISLSGGRLGVCSCSTVDVAQNDRQAILAAADNNDL